MKSTSYSAEELNESAKDAFERAVAKHRAMLAPIIPDGYKSVKEWAKINGHASNTAYRRFEELCESGLADRRTIMVNGHETCFYRLK